MKKSQFFDLLLHLPCRVDSIRFYISFDKYPPQIGAIIVFQTTIALTVTPLFSIVSNRERRQEYRFIGLLLAIETVLLLQIPLNTFLWTVSHLKTFHCSSWNLIWADFSVRLLR